MLYLVTSPGCPACIDHRTRLREAGREFTEVDAHALSSGREMGLPLSVRATLLAELSLLEGKLPLEMDIP